MTCSHCGRRMAGFYRKWKDNKLNYYRCYNHTQNGICDNKHCISERKIEEFVLQDMIKNVMKLHLHLLNLRTLMKLNYKTKKQIQRVKYHV